MFNLEENKQAIMKLIDSRENNEIVIPVYIRLYNNKYFLHELDQIKMFNPAAFKVGFGSSNGMFIKNSFPNQLLLNYDETQVFMDVDADTGVAVRYVLFESNDKNDGTTAVDSQIIFYSEKIRAYLEKQCEEYRRQLIQSQMEESN